MAAVKKYAGIVNAWGREREAIRVGYDFAVDGGATGALDLFKAGEKLIVESAKMVVKRACTSGGSATVGCGQTADLAGLIAATAVASLTADAVIFGAAQDASHVLAADAVVQMNIATAALTDGAIDFLFEIQKA